MRNLDEYAIMCKKELDNIGIQYGNIIEFKVNTRAKHRWGQCKKIQGGYSININVVLLDERNSEKGLKETIIHEILHTCSDCKHHDINWKRYADMVNKAYGYHVKRVSSAQEKGILYDTRDIKHKKANYVIKCERCGKKVVRQRASNLIKHPEQYCCGFCNGNFVRE